MRASFPEGETVILKNSEGTEFAVTHHIGSTYSIAPVRK